MEKFLPLRLQSARDVYYRFTLHYKKENLVVERNLGDFLFVIQTINKQNFEYASFRGQTAPTGSFSAKTLPVGPEYHGFGTSNGTIRQTFEQNSACRSSERFYQQTFSIDPHMFCRNSSFNCLVVVQFLKSPCMSQMIEIHTEINI